MMLGASIAVILILSFILAIRSVKKELSVPDEVKNMQVRQRLAQPLSGSIVFFREKIVHYSSEEPASESADDDS